MVRSNVVASFVFVFVFVDFRAVTAHPRNDYCQVSSCDLQMHTACLFTSRGPSTHCVGRIIDSGLTSEEKQRIVDLHNQLRQKVASGQETRGSPGPQPAAKSMPLVEWDDELAHIAQKWANQCTWGHDNCRDVERFKVGQNIAYLGTTGNVYELKVDDMVQSWYDEVQHFSRNSVARFSNQSGNGSPIGHYTQMVWATSTKIGCGAVKYRDAGFNKFYLVCNYGPAGNYLGQPVYETR